MLEYTYAHRRYPQAWTLIVGGSLGKVNKAGEGASLHFSPPIFSQLLHLHFFTLLMFCDPISTLSLNLPHILCYHRVTHGFQHIVTMVKSYQFVKYLGKNRTYQWIQQACRYVLLPQLQANYQNIDQVAGAIQQQLDGARFASPSIQGLSDDSVRFRLCIGVAVTLLARGLVSVDRGPSRRSRQLIINRKSSNFDIAFVMSRIMKGSGIS
jgi:hypothetical protein